MMFALSLLISLFTNMQQTNKSSHDKTFIYSITAIPTIIVEVLKKDNNAQSEGEATPKLCDMTFYFVWV